MDWDGEWIRVGEEEDVVVDVDAGREERLSVRLELRLVDVRR